MVKKKTSYDKSKLKAVIDSKDKMSIASNYASNEPNKLNDVRNTSGGGNAFRAGVITDKHGNLIPQNRVKPSQAAGLVSGPLIAEMERKNKGRVLEGQGRLLSSIEAEDKTKKEGATKEALAEIGTTTPATEEEAATLFPPDQTMGLLEGLPGRLANTAAAFTPGLGSAANFLTDIPGIENTKFGRMGEARRRVTNQLIGQALTSLGVENNPWSKSNQLQAKNKEEAEVFDEKLTASQAIGFYFDNIPVVSGALKKIGIGKAATTVINEATSRPGDISSFAFEMGRASNAIAQEAMDNYESEAITAEQANILIAQQLSNINRARGKYKKVLMYNSELGDNKVIIAADLTYFNNYQQAIIERQGKLGLIPV